MRRQRHNPSSTMNSQGKKVVQKEIEISKDQTQTWKTMTSMTENSNSCYEKIK